MDTASAVFASAETLSFESLPQEIRDLLARLGLGQAELEKLVDPRQQYEAAGWWN